MKKLLYLILIAFVLIPLSLYAETFTLTVTFCNGGDCGDTTAPSVPANLIVTSVTSSQVNLSWDASIDPGPYATGVLGYSIFRDGNPTALATTTGISYSDTGLSPVTSYSYTVSAFDLRNNVSSQTSAVSTTTLANNSSAPNASNGSPSGTLSAGTTQTTLSLNTDINATCKYGTTANIAYASIANTFGTTGGTSHSSTITGLSDGSSRTFYVRCQNSSNIPMTSDYIISFSVSSGSSGGGGGGGGGSSPSTPTLPNLPESVIVRGIAYPGSTVTLLKDGQFVSSTQAGPDAKFEINFAGITEGTYTFNVWAKDVRGNRSVLFPFTVKLTRGATNVISGIFIPPTISIDKKQVRKGDPITVLGASNPSATISILFHSPVEIVKSVKADVKGFWKYTMDTIELDYGDHTTQSRAKSGDEISSFSQTLGFIVGTSNIAAVGGVSTLIGDFNFDGKVNLIDFSILLYWYKRTLTAATPAGIDMNNDGKVNLVDFSIIAYHWTG